MVNKFDFGKIKSSAEDIIRSKLLWKPSKFTIEVTYKIEDFRHYMYVRADEWAYNAVIDDKVIEDGNMSVFYYHLDRAARSLNDEFRRKHDIPPIPPDIEDNARLAATPKALGDHRRKERREPDSIYPPW